MAPKSERLRWINPPICWNCPEVFTTVKVACGQSSNHWRIHYLFFNKLPSTKKEELMIDGVPTSRLLSLFPLN